jgi:hypothetical protein
MRFIKAKIILLTSILVVGLFNYSASAVPDVAAPVIDRLTAPSTSSAGSTIALIGA